MRVKNKFKFSVFIQFYFGFVLLLLYFIYCFWFFIFSEVKLVFFFILMQIFIFIYKCRRPKLKTRWPNFWWQHSSWLAKDSLKQNACDFLFDFICITDRNCQIQPHQTDINADVGVCVCLCVWEPADTSSALNFDHMLMSSLDVKCQKIFCRLNLNFQLQKSDFF